MKKRKKQVAVVRCNGGRDTMKTAPGSLAGDCSLLASARPNDAEDCAYGCLGGGSCIEACPRQAMALNQYRVALVDREKCAGCGLCAKACPRGLIVLVLPENTIAPLCANREPAARAKKQCPVSCLACRLCEKNCPAEAITVVDNCAEIDQNRCISCGMCAVKCPRGVIVDADGIFTAVA